MAQTLQYAFPAAAAYPHKVAVKKARKADKEMAKTLSPEDMELVMALNAVKDEVALLHSRFDQTTDETLVDALIFELKAAGLRYKYLHTKLKEKDIVNGDCPVFLPPIRSR